MLEEDKTVVALEDEYTVEQMKDLLRWMYVREFQCKGADLSCVMSLAHIYQADRAIRQCAVELAQDMTIENACAYLDQEVAMRAKGEGQNLAGFEKLWSEARDFIQKEFQEINGEILVSEKLVDLNVEGIKVVLASESVRIGTENTMFSIYRAWVHANFEERKQFASVLLPLLRFSQVRKDFLLDVIKKEGELGYPEEGKKVFARKIIDAYVYHTTSQERRDALKLVTEQPRTYDDRLLKEVFVWKIEGMGESKELWSEPFYLGGYFLHLLMQRKNPQTAGGGTIGLYLHIKENGLTTEFYVPFAFELLVKNQRTGKWASPKGAYASPFTSLNKAWGYVDMLSTTWEDFFKDTCPYNKGGVLEVKANVWFKDYWEKVKATNPK